MVETNEGYQETAFQDQNMTLDLWETGEPILSQEVSNAIAETSTPQNKSFSVEHLMSPKKFEDLQASPTHFSYQPRFNIDDRIWEMQLEMNLIE